jgi:hypothetical protein
MLGADKTHIVAYHKTALGGLCKSGTGIFHSIDYGCQLLVGERASDDRGVDCFDIHLELLFAEHVCIIAFRALVVYRFITTKVAFLPQKNAT